MNTQEMKSEISRQAAAMNEYHASRFASAAFSRFCGLPHADVSRDSIASFARSYTTGVERERDRILSIDAALKTMPPGCEDLAHTAKFETRMDAATFRQHAIRALGQTSHTMSRMRR